MADENGNRTHYIVLEYVPEGLDTVGGDDGDGTWRKLGEATANNADQARRHVAQQHLDLEQLRDGVDLVAITKRSWDAGQGTVHAKTETKVVSS